MKLCQLLEKVKIQFTNADLEMDISGICYDSRKAMPGYVFVAVKGIHVDGNRFIESAVGAGCKVVICEEVPQISCSYVQVSDARKALAAISCAFYDYPAGKMKVIGITGTSGKTTTTHLVKHIIEATTGEKVGLVGTNGNMIGDEFVHTEYTTPESLELQELFSRMVAADCTYAVMEVSSHSLCLDRVYGIPFATAAFTNLSQDHLDFHGTMEEYARQKKKLFSMCKRSCFNLDDRWSAFLMDNISCPILTTSAEDEKASLLAEDIILDSKGVSFTVRYCEETEQISLAIPGGFSVYNALTAISVCLSEGLSLKSCAEALKSASGVKGRVEAVPTDGDYSIIIDYSHKPDALEKVLLTLRPITRGRLICLFGCGGDRDKLKRPIMAEVAADHSDYVIVTSDNPRTEDPDEIISEIVRGFEGKNTPFETECDRITAIHRAIDMVQPGDVILLAGKGHEDYQVIGHEKHDMDERKIVSEYLISRTVKY